MFLRSVKILRKVLSYLLFGILWIIIVKLIIKVDIDYIIPLCFQVSFLCSSLLINFVFINCVIVMRTLHFNGKFFGRNIKVQDIQTNRDFTFILDLAFIEKFLYGINNFLLIKAGSHIFNLWFGVFL